MSAFYSFTLFSASASVCFCGVVSLNARRASPATLVNFGVNRKLTGGKIHHNVVSSDCTILTRSAPSFFASSVKSRTAPSSEASPIKGRATAKCSAALVILMWTASEPSTSFNPLKSGALLVIAQPAMDSSTIALAVFNPYIMSVFPSLCFRFRFLFHWLRHMDNHASYVPTHVQKTDN